MELSCQVVAVSGHQAHQVSAGSARTGLECTARLGSTYYLCRILRPPAGIAGEKGLA